MGQVSVDQYSQVRPLQTDSFVRGILNEGGGFLFLCLLYDVRLIALMRVKFSTTVIIVIVT